MTYIDLINYLRTERVVTSGRKLVDFKVVTHNDIIVIGSAGEKSLTPSEMKHKVYLHEREFDNARALYMKKYHFKESITHDAQKLKMTYLSYWFAVLAHCEQEGMTI